MAGRIWWNAGSALTLPGRLHVADVTYVRLASGSFAYVAFVTDAYARRIVGWAVGTSQHATRLPLIALDQSISGLYGTRLNQAGILASTGGVGDS